MSLAKPAAWLPESCEELLKDAGGRLDTSAPSQASVHQSQSRTKAAQVRGEIHGVKVNTALLPVAAGLWCNIL